MSPDDSMTPSTPDVPQISRDELWDKIERGDHFLLFEVLGAQFYKRHHLPGALHLPPDRVVETVTALAPDRATEIVTYCWDDDCPTSAWAARELRAIGYTNVREFPGGKQEWQSVGLPLERD